MRKNVVSIEAVRKEILLSISRLNDLVDDSVLNRDEYIKYIAKRLSVCEEILRDFLLKK